MERVITTILIETDSKKKGDKLIRKFEKQGFEHSYSTVESSKEITPAFRHKLVKQENIKKCLKN